jgi:hypothetical protein
MRLLTGLFIGSVGVFLALLGLGQFSAHAQQRNNTATKTTNLSLLGSIVLSCAPGHRHAGKLSGWRDLDLLRRNPGRLA